MHREPPAKKIFISYTQADEAYLQDLKKQLFPIQRQGIVQTWDVSRLMPGEEGGVSTRRELQTAEIVLLLVSPDFMANEEVWNEEMKSAMARHEKDKTVVIPIIIRPILWQEAPFAKFKALPANGLPVSSWNNTDEAWLEVAEKIKLIADY
ncbi:MAG: toll/interleukin-1 receptor domain-containing protein [Saprospiraceae bacterium]|nr:toll/interleukin-1 receptor domain-containing protein [Saprospiraceae bacterium]